MGEMATTLAAISAGAVFMGANSYIGNAPNFMVKAIVEERRHSNAQLLRLHGLVVRHPGAAVPGADPDILLTGKPQQICTSIQ
jgi:hypothetical protein